MRLSRLVSAQRPTPDGALRAWSLGPLPCAERSARWTLPEVFEAPDEVLSPRRSRTASFALLALLLGVFALTLGATDPLDRGWRSPLRGVARRAEPGVERVVAALARSLGRP